MVRDTLKAIHRKTRERQKQAAPLRLGEAMLEGQAPPEGVTVNALLASCGTDVIGLRDAALRRSRSSNNFRRSRTVSRA